MPNFKKNTYQSIKRISYAIVGKNGSDIETISYDPANRVSIIFKPLKAWKSLYTTRQSPVFEESEKYTDQGLSYNQKLEVKASGESDATNFEFFELAHKPLILKIEYINNDTKIIGDILNPVWLLKKQSTADLQNNTLLVFSREADRPASYLIT